MSKYFDRFPLTDYNGDVVRNILAKVDLAEQTQKDIYSYYEYEMKEGLTRFDILSNNYYENPEYHWVFYLVNNCVDPYYNFYLNQHDFTKYIEKKYGSETAAREQIVFYRNNWYLLDDSSITVDVYDSLLKVQQQYYKPILNTSQQTIRYERVKKDWIQRTNAVVELTVADVTGYSINERITQASTSASATIRSIDTTSNILIVEHITGVFVEGTLGDTTITNVNEIYRAISSNESAFWVAVTAYEYEEEANEAKKHIFVLPNNYLPKFDSEFKDKISQ